MKKSFLWVIGLLLGASIGCVSCEETTGTPDPYTDWEDRNQAFIDSIARVAKASPDQWKILHSYKFVPPINDLNPDVNDYVYCKVLEEGTGTFSPYYTDTVSTNYRGKLIPLYNGSEVVFDESYQGTLKPEIAVPVEFAVSGVIDGWTTALQYMKEGDRWEVYIPYTLAFGTYGQSSIPGYSTLIFDMQLVEIKTNR